jgi:hypothetical protein
MTQWSKGLQSQTTEILYNIDPCIFALNERLGNKGVMMKNCDDGFGYITLESCLAEEYIIRDHVTDEVLGAYTTIADLIQSGWAAD